MVRLFSPSTILLHTLIIVISPVGLVRLLTVRVLDLSVVSLVPIDLQENLIFVLLFSKTVMIRTLSLALGSIIVGVEQFELSSPSWSKPPTTSSTFSTSFSATFSTSFFLSKVKCDCLTGEREPRRGKDKVGRECRLGKH